MIRRWLGVVAVTIVLLSPSFSQAQRAVHYPYPVPQINGPYHYPYNYGYTMGAYPYYYSYLYPSAETSVHYTPQYQTTYIPGLGYSLRYDDTGTNNPLYNGYQGFVPTVASSRSNAPTGNSLADNTATLDVRVPDPAAEVWIDGHKTKQTGTARQFVSPTLTPGRTYQYVIKAEWMVGGRKVEQSQKLTVQAGQRMSIDFLSPTAQR